MDALRQHLFVGCSNRVMAIVVENVKTRAAARTMALDSQRQRIYLVTAEYGPKPPATNDKPNPRPPIIPGSFTLLTLAR